MRILISGASGFIGRHLVEHLLEDRHELMLLIRNPTQPKDGITWLKGDLETPQDLKERIEQFQPEAVFHLAWAGIPDFSESQCRLNVQLSLNFLGMISQISSVKKLVVAGSCWEYGDRVGECTESDETHAHNWFTWAKDTICQYTERLCDDRQIDWYWGRVFFVYGPGQRENSLIPAVMRAMKADKIPDVRSPYAKNDFIYIEDLVKGLACCLADGCVSGIYNFGSGEETAVIEIVRSLEILLHDNSVISDQIIRNVNAPDEPIKGFYANTNASNSKLNWQAKISIQQGLENLLKGNN